LAPAQASGCIKQSANGLPRGSNHVLSPVTRCLSINLIIGQAGKNVNPLLANRCQSLWAIPRSYAKVALLAQITLAVEGCSSHPVLTASAFGYQHPALRNRLLSVSEAARKRDV